MLQANNSTCWQRAIVTALKHQPAVVNTNDVRVTQYYRRDDTSAMFVPTLWWRPCGHAPPAHTAPATNHGCGIRHCCPQYADHLSAVLNRVRTWCRSNPTRPGGIQVKDSCRAESAAIFWDGEIRGFGLTRYRKKTMPVTRGMICAVDLSTTCGYWNNSFEMYALYTKS